MIDSQEGKDAPDATLAARDAFDALMSPLSDGPGGTAAEPSRECPARTPEAGELQAATAAHAAMPGGGSAPGPRPFSKSLEDHDEIGAPSSITWAAGFGVPSPTPGVGVPGDPSARNVKSGLFGRRSRRRDGRLDPELIRHAESAESGSSDTRTRIRQVGIFAGVVAAAVIATFIVASAIRGPAREEARLSDENELEGLDRGDSEVPDPVRVDEDGQPPKTAPPSTSPDAPSSSESTSVVAGSSGTVKTAPPSTRGFSPIDPEVKNGQQVVYMVSGLGLTFTTPAGNCAEFEGNPLCTHIGLEVGERLTLSRIGDLQTETNIWLLDPSGGLALKETSATSYVFEAKSPIDRGNIVVYGDGLIPLFIDYAIVD